MATTLIALVPLVVNCIRYEAGDKFTNQNDAEAAASIVAGQAAVPNATLEQVEEFVGSTSTDAPLWNKVMDPADYLRQYPTGPSAPLAAEILAFRADNEGNAAPHF